MNSNKQNLINKILYRSQYRGTKEMDIFLSSFVKSIINSLNFDELVELNNLISLNDDEIINNGGETGIRTQERVAPLPVFKTGAFNRSAISP